jgi:hypothetical protein
MSEFLKLREKLKYVEGASECYLYLNTVNGEPQVCDYGGIGNKELIELLARYVYEKDKNKVLRDYLIETIAKRLDVKLIERKKK